MCLNKSPNHLATSTKQSTGNSSMLLATTSAYLAKDMLRITLVNLAKGCDWSFDRLAQELWVEGSEVCYQDVTNYLFGWTNFEQLDSIQISLFAQLLGWSMLEVRIAGGQLRLTDLVSGGELQQIRKVQQQHCADWTKCSDDLALFDWALTCQGDQGILDAALLLLPSYARVAQAAWPEISAAELKELQVLV